MSTPGTYIASAQPLAVFIGRCEPCNRPVRTTSDTFMGDHYTAQCPDCRKWTKLQRLYGTVTKMNCHPDCQSAYGLHCECACGGINHGDVWSRSGEMLAGYLAIYRADRERRQEASRKAAQTRADKKAARLRAAFGIWAEDHTALLSDLAGTDWLHGTDYPNETLADFAAIVGRGEMLTEPQSELAARIIARRREVRERIAAEQAEKAARAVNFIEVPEGRQVITGTIIAAWTYDGDWGTVWKIKVDCGTYQVRGTLPRNLETETLPARWNGDDYRNLKTVLKGKRVTLTAALKPDGRELGQGFFNRPAKASFITETETAQAPC